MWRDGVGQCQTVQNATEWCMVQDGTTWYGKVPYRAEWCMMVWGDAG